jgi:hypothetical protein
MEPFSEIEVTLASPPGHPGMLAELRVIPGGETVAHFADVYRGDGLILRLYQNGDDDRLHLSLTAFLDAISLALARLGEDGASTAENYLRDLGSHLRQMAIDAKREYEAVKGSTDAGEREYRAGYLMAFHRVVSLMQQQAMGFQMPYEAISMALLDADRDLL